MTYSLDQYAEDMLRMMKARVALMIRFPFFGQLLFRAKFRPEPKIAEIATEGRDIFYNPEFVKESEDSDLEYALCQTVMRKVWMHPARRNGRDLKRWNKATTYVINSFLKSCNMKLPENALYDSRYDGNQWSADDVYIDLLKRDPDDKTPDNHSPGAGFGDGSPDALLDDSHDPSDGEGKNKQPQDAAEHQKLQDDMQQELASARQHAKEAGNLPSAIDKLVDQLLTPKEDWRNRMREFMMRGGTDDVTWRKPNRRMFAHGVYLPIQESELMPNMALLFDTSGSIYASQDTLAVFMSEIKAIAEDLTPENINVIQCDAQVTKVDDFPRGEEVEFELKGGGGTRFSPAFDVMLEQEQTPEVAIYFTDLYCSDFGPDPGIPVLWAVYDNDTPVHELRRQVPFGDVIKIED